MPGAATGVGFEWQRFAAGAGAFEKTGEYIPKELYDSIEKNRVALKGPVTTPVGGGFRFDQRDAAEEVRAVCEFSAGEESAGIEDATIRGWI